MKTNAVLLFTLLLCACGSKDNVSTKSNEAFMGSAGQGETGQPTVPVQKPTAGTVYQIACEATPLVGALAGSPGFGEIKLPTSQNAAGQHVIDAIPKLSSASDVPNRAPTLLEVRDSVAAVLVHSGEKVFLVRYDLTNHAVVGQPEVVGSAGAVRSDVYRELGFSEGRLAASSPDGKVFVFTAKGSLSLRSVKTPTVPVSRASVNGSFAQPRWEGSEIFVDRVAGGNLRQAVVSVSAGYATLGLRAVPAALDGGYDQIGLRRLDAGSYVWLERNSKRAVIRVWNPATAATRNYELPGGGMYGPGFALYREAPGAEAQVVLNSAKGMHYFRLAANGTVTGESFSYPQDTLDTIHGRSPQSPPWYPGAVYSTAGDTQLFTVIPSTAGYQKLMAVDSQYGYRLLDFDTCINPDFFRVGE